jgi:hypothetical protein
MKKLNLVKMFLLTAGIVLAVSCKKDKSEDSQSVTKLVSGMSFGTDSIAFSYNSDGVLIQTSDYSKGSGSVYVKNYERDYTYNNNVIALINTYLYTSGVAKANVKDSIIYDSSNRPSKIFEYYFISGAFVPTDTTTFVYNTDNKPVKLQYSDVSYLEFIYTGSNITTENYFYSGSTSATTCSFNDKINPFKGNIYAFPNDDYYNTNLPVQEISTDSEYNYTYEYDKDGYITKQTKTWGTGADDNEVRKIYYK